MIIVLLDSKLVVWFEIYYKIRGSVKFVLIVLFM